MKQKEFKWILLANDEHGETWCAEVPGGWLFRVMIHGTPSNLQFVPKPKDEK